jgi:hypothetical protein
MEEIRIIPCCNDGCSVCHPIRYSILTVQQALTNVRTSGHQFVQCDGTETSQNLNRLENAVDVSILFFQQDELLQFMISIMISVLSNLKENIRQIRGKFDFIEPQLKVESQEFEQRQDFE